MEAFHLEGIEATLTACDIQRTVEEDISDVLASVIATCNNHQGR